MELPDFIKLQERLKGMDMSLLIEDLKELENICESPEEDCLFREEGGFCPYNFCSQESYSSSQEFLYR